MVDYKNKKWCWITALYAKWAPPSPTEIWTRDSERNFTRLLQAHAYHIDYVNEINVNEFDVFCMVQFNIENIEKELQFFKLVKSLGKKTVLCFSADFRFTVGQGLASTQGTLYTDLCEYADVILSGMPQEYGLFGRFQHKVLPWGLPLERLNFSKPYEQRDIDVLFSSSAGEESFPFNIELLMLLKQTYPNINILYTMHDTHSHWLPKYVNRGIPFAHIDLMQYLPRSKVYINCENRIRGGRALEEAWHCRTPFISSDMTFYSQIFSDYRYNKMNMQKIVELYGEIRNNDYNTIIQKAEQNVENLYFDKAILILMNKLYGE